MPFTPHLVIFSFGWSDAKIPFGQTLDDEVQAARLSALATAFEDFVALFKETETKLLCWLPNPVYPTLCNEKSYDSETTKQWMESQSKFFESVLNQLRQNCKRLEIPLVDARALFEVDGLHSAQKWMSNWFMHNEQGAANIANWIEDAIVKNKLIDADAFDDIPVETEAPSAEPVVEETPTVETEPVAEEVPAAEIVEAKAPAAESVTETAPAEAVAETTAEEKTE